MRAVEEPGSFACLDALETAGPLRMGDAGADGVGWNAEHGSHCRRDSRVVVLVRAFHADGAFVVACFDPRSTDALALAANDREDGRRECAVDQWSVWARDARLLARDLLQRIAELVHVIERDLRDRAALHRVGGE